MLVVLLNSEEDGDNVYSRNHSFGFKPGTSFATFPMILCWISFLRWHDCLTWCDVGEKKYGIRWEEAKVVILCPILHPKNWLCVYLFLISPFLYSSDQFTDQFAKLIIIIMPSENIVFLFFFISFPDSKNIYYYYWLLKKKWDLYKIKKKIIKNDTFMPAIWTSRTLLAFTSWE